MNNRVNEMWHSLLLNEIWIDWIGGLSPRDDNCHLALPLERDTHSSKEFVFSH